jgi:hypothetical protein
MTRQNWRISSGVPRKTRMYLFMDGPDGPPGYCFSRNKSFCVRRFSRDEGAAVRLGLRVKQHQQSCPRSPVSVVLTLRHREKRERKIYTADRFRASNDQTVSYCLAKICCFGQVAALISCINRSNAVVFQANAGMFKQIPGTNFFA